MWRLHASTALYRIEFIVKLVVALSVRLAVHGPHPHLARHAELNNWLGVNIASNCWALLRREEFRKRALAIPQPAPPLDIVGDAAHVFACVHLVPALRCRRIALSTEIIDRSFGCRYGSGALNVMSRQAAARLRAVCVLADGGPIPQLVWQRIRHT